MDLARRPCSAVQRSAYGYRKTNAVISAKIGVDTCLLGVVAERAEFELSIRSGEIAQISVGPAPSIELGSEPPQCAASRVPDDPGGLGRLAGMVASYTGDGIAVGVTQIPQTPGLCTGGEIRYTRSGYYLAVSAE